MELKILCTQWGHERLPAEAFLLKVKEAGYDGVDTWLPETTADRSRFIRLLEQYDLAIVSHQHQATGHSIADYCRSLEYYLELSLECNPVLINSHSGRDYFTADEQLQVIDCAENFSARNSVLIAHETHRGRIGFSPGNFSGLAAVRPGMKITADLSHWVCVTESYLENFQDILTTAVERTAHTHARMGFPEGPQIPDPRSAVWQESVNYFVALWNRIFDFRKFRADDLFTITPEFGPPPYMWVQTDGSPVASQWDINIYIKDLLRTEFATRM